MRHDTSTPEEAGDTAALLVSVQLAPLRASTRSGTLYAVRRLRDALGDGGEIPVAHLAAAVADPHPTLKTSMPRWPQVASDVRRALRLHADPARRALALRLAGAGVPTLADAIDAAALFEDSPDTLQRLRTAVTRFAAAQGGAPAALTASATAVEGPLRAMRPEDLGVGTLKSLENQRALVRRAVRRVDPHRLDAVAGAGGGALSRAWTAALEHVCAALPKSETGTLAILQRLGRAATAAGETPAGLSARTVDECLGRDLATHGPAYCEKMRRACRVWNAAVAGGLKAPRIAAPTPPAHRQPSVDWHAVPTAIRAPVDAVLEKAVSVRAPADWGAFVGDGLDEEDAALGLPDPDGGAAAACASGARVLEPGTRENWRRAVKRAWQAAMADPRVEPKPETLAEMYTAAVARAVVRAARASRRDRVEARGERFDPAEKGRYEHSLLETLRVGWAGDRDRRGRPGGGRCPEAGDRPVRDRGAPRRRRHREAGLRAAPDRHAPRDDAATVPRRERPPALARSAWHALVPRDGTGDGGTPCRAGPCRARTLGTHRADRAVLRTSQAHGARPPAPRRG